MSVVQAVQSEYRAALEGCAVFDAGDRQLLRVTGSEAGSFLQGMVTNDVEGLAVGASCYAAVLTVKGGMVADVRVLKRASDFLVETSSARLVAVKDYLNKYLISEDAEIHDAPELSVLSFVGPKFADARALISSVEGELISFVGGLDVVVLREKLDETWNVLASVPRLSKETLEVLRVEKAVPLFGVDMTEVTIPLEANLEHAIHYKKGCYIGQEVIARATYRGQMNKKLVQLLVGDAEPAWKAELKLGERKVGFITSVVKSEKHGGQHLALGYVHRDFLTSGTKFELGAGSATIA
ncbi:MAG: aminomethyl transferase family protein [Archangium sp.]